MTPKERLQLESFYTVHQSPCCSAKVEGEVWCQPRNTPMSHFLFQGILRKNFQLHPPWQNSKMAIDSNQRHQLAPLHLALNSITGIISVLFILLNPFRIWKTPCSKKHDGDYTIETHGLWADGQVTRLNVKILKEHNCEPPTPGKCYPKQSKK